MKRKTQKNQMIASNRKSGKSKKNKKAKIIKNENGGEALSIDNEIDLKEIVKGLELVKLKSDVLTCKYLSSKEENISNAVLELSEKLIDIQSNEIKFNNCNEALESLVKENIKDNFYSAEILESIMFLFESCICLAMADSLMIESLRLVYDDEESYTIAMGISVVAEGIYNGAKRALTGEDSECDCDDCREKKENDENYEGDDLEIDMKKTKKVYSLEEKRLATYETWEEMLARCEDPEHPEYKNEGAKGITVCDRWNPKKGGSFNNFVEDMGLCPD
jgi:hypothetical protein